jgi:hypothetical protein
MHRAIHCVKKKENDALVSICPRQVTRRVFVAYVTTLAISCIEKLEN